MSRFNQSTSTNGVVTTTGELLPKKTYMETPKKLVVHYSDVNSDYNIDNKGLLVFDKSAINKQISNILSTPINSEHFEPDFGSLLPYHIFENITTITAWTIRNDSIVAVGRWMGERITIIQEETSVEPVNGEAGSEGYSIYMPYIINASKTADKFSALVTR